MAADGQSFTKVLGFDLGDGESALAECAVGGGGEPDVLKIVDQQQSFLTCLGKDRSGKVLLGQAALNASDVQSAFLTFKRRGGNEADQARTLASEFFREVISRAQHAGCDLTHTSIVVGHPSAWSPDDVTQYTHALRGNATWKLDGISESRAAFLQLKETGKLTVAQLKSTSLIVDIGSSTTDMTIIRNLKQEPLDFGHNTLGGRLIDRAILAWAIAKHPSNDRIQSLLRQNQHIYAQCEYTARQAKEAFFSNEEALRNSGDSAPNRQFVEIDDETIFRVKLDGKSMDAILKTPLADLGGTTWADAYRSTLQDLRSKCQQQNGLPVTIAMTGGSARMGFTRQICREVFPEAELILDTSPEFTIAKGLSRAGRWDLRAAVFLNELEPLCEQLPQAFQNEAQAFLNEVVPKLAANFIPSVVRQSLLDWRSGSVATLNDLEAQMKRKGATWANSGAVRSIIEEATKTWSQRAMVQMAPAIQGLTHKYDLPYEVLNLSLHVETPKGTSVNAASVRTEASTTMGFVAGGIAGIIAVKIAVIVVPIIIAVLVKSTIIAAAFAGPIGWIIGAVAVGATFFGMKDWTEERVKANSIPVMLRSMLLSDSKLNSACEKAHDEVLSALKDELQKATKNELATNASNVVKQELQQKMKEAILLIGR
jgi:hypothetical protein